jgi:Tol biopolymer transport system component
MYERSTNRRIQLTAGLGDSIKPTMNNDGRLVVFQSHARCAAAATTCGQLQGAAGANWELFLLDRETGTFRQLTNTGGDSFNASLGGGGRYIPFISTGDVKGTGSTGQHMFLYDLLYDEVYQVTKGAGSSDNPVATAGHDLLLREQRRPAAPRDHRNAHLRAQRLRVAPGPLARHAEVRAPARPGHDRQPDPSHEPRRRLYRADRGGRASTSRSPDRTSTASRA